MGAFRKIWTSIGAIMSELQHFGPVRADVNHDDQAITLTYQPGRDPLGAGVIANLKAWALSVLQGDYPDYEIQDLTDGR